MGRFSSEFYLFEAPLPSLLFLLDGRGPGEGRRVVSRSPSPLLFLFVSCLQLRGSPLAHFRLFNHIFTISDHHLHFLRRLFHFAGAQLAVQSILASKFRVRIFCFKKFLTFFKLV